MYTQAGPGQAGGRESGRGGEAGCGEARAAGRRSGAKGGEGREVGYDLIENITSQCRYHFQESNSGERAAS